MNGLIHEVTGIRPLAFWKQVEGYGRAGSVAGSNGSNGRKGIPMRHNKRKYKKGLPWQRHNGFGHRIRKFCIRSVAMLCTLTF